MVAHCRDGLTACNDPVEEARVADAADERWYQQLAVERPEGGRRRDATLSPSGRLSRLVPGYMVSAKHGGSHGKGRLQD